MRRIPPTLFRLSGGLRDSTILELPTNIKAVEIISPDGLYIECYGNSIELAQLRIAPIPFSPSLPETQVLRLAYSHPVSQARTGG